MLITCVKCGQSFDSRLNLTPNSNGGRGVKHSPGCGYTNHVSYTKGKITKIK